MNPLISVMMPAYNAAATIPMAIASLRAQTYEQWELILVDDGSTDGTGELIQQYKDERIRYIALDRNYGRGYARQVALENCRGDFLAVLDADDLWLPQKLEIQLKFLKDNPDTVSCGSNVLVLDREYKPICVKGGALEGSIVRIDSRKILHVPLGYWCSSLTRMPVAERFCFDDRLLRG
ncbi:MAG TPA: glycosyltransferase family 2 protein [Anaerolineales bacterium]|nr:glycosyltransferase family 2 protein [Anaerolineales bacterium]